MQHYPGTILTRKGFVFEVGSSKLHSYEATLAALEVQDECGVYPEGAFCLVFF